MEQARRNRQNSMEAAPARPPVLLIRITDSSDRIHSLPQAGDAMLITSF